MSEESGPKQVTFETGTKAGEDAMLGVPADASAGRVSTYLQG